MGRLLAIVVVLGSLGVFFVIQAQGMDRAFGGALARFTKPSAPIEAPEPERRQSPDWWEREGSGSRPPGIAQGVRERVNRHMETGTKRHGGGQ